MMNSENDSPEPRKSQKRSKPAKLRLTDRDTAIITAVWHHRALETPQIEKLFFASDPDLEYGNKMGCTRRLRQLTKAGYLWRGEQARRKPAYYRIDRKGVELLPELLGVEPERISWRPDENEVSDLFLNHLLRTNDVRIAITQASENHGFFIHRWLDDKTLKSDHAKDYVTLTNTNGSKQQVAVIPDGYFHLTQPIEGTDDFHYHHLIEVDLGTIQGTSPSQPVKWTRRNIARKIKIYIEYFSSGQYQKRYQTKSLRILFITTTPRRMENLKQITEDVGGKHRFWFSTLDQVTPQTVLTEPIWQIAKKEGQYALIDLLEPDSPPTQATSDVAQSGKTT